MPTVQNNLTNAAEPKTEYQTAAHNGELKTASLDAVETDAQATIRLPEEVRHVPNRYSVSSVGVKSALQASAFWIFCYALFFGSELAWRLASGKPLTAVFITGELLDKTIWGLVVYHIVAFQGRTSKAWAISWLFRFVMFFASSCLSDMAQNRTTVWYHHSVWAFLVATATVAWQYNKQSNAAKKRDIKAGETP